MKKIIRYLLIGIVVSIVFLVAAVGIFVAVFDANAYKQDLSDLVRAETGRELEFHGDVDLTIYPALGMKLGAMSFSNAPGFGALPMVKVKQASISVDVASLFRLSPEVEKLVLRDLEINLEKNKAGVTNWDDLIKPADPAKADDSASTGTADSGGGGDFEIKGAFGGLDLQNIRLLWRDQQAGEEYRVNDLDISTGRIEPNKPFPIKLHLDAAGSGDLDIVFDLQTNIEYLIEQEQLTLSDMLLKLNQFEIKGRVQVSNFAKPALRFDLASGNIDVDELLGTPPPEPEPEVAAGPAEDVQIVLPMQTLRDLDIDGSLKISQVKVQNLKLADVDIQVKAKDGQVGITPLSLNLYGGKVETSVAIDATGEKPKYAVDKSIQNVQVGKLLADFLGDDAPVSGKFDAMISLTTEGEWLSKLKLNSNGKMQMSFLDGALKGFNLRHAIDTAKAKLKGKEPPPESQLKTDFSALKISGLIRKGVFSSDDLDLQAPLLRVSGKGEADLNTEMVDYLVKAKLVGSVEGQEGGSADDLSGLEIPVSIKGPFTAPKIDVQLDEMLKARLDAEKAKLKARADAEKAKLKAKLEEEKAKIEAQKAELKKQLEAEKKALAESQKRELEQKKEVAEAQAKAQAEAEKKKLEDKLKDKLKKLTE